MKKRTSIIPAVIGLAVIVALILLINSVSTTSYEPDLAALETANFKTIDGSKTMVYNSDTKVVYYMFSTGKSYRGYGYMAPYISENGNFCRYINDEIVEITTDISN